jgi:tetratricopeptide (TPR) repeat protein
VRAADAAHADLVGARVLQIGSASADEACAAAGALVGRDNDMDVKFFAPLLLSMPEVLHALGLVADMEKASFTVETEGRSRVVGLSPVGPADLLPPDTDTSGMRRGGWIDARGDTDPLWLRDPKNKFWFESLPESRALYVQFNQVGNKDDETIEAFSKRLSAFIDSNAVDRVILDLRLNRGGNGSLNRPLIVALIRAARVDRPGGLFVLIGRSTWSAAQMLVNDLELYTDAVFVGEPTGGKINHYGDSRRITLPNSGITVRVSTLWWQGDERDKRPWKAPDLAAEPTFADYRANRDPALAAAIAYTPEKTLADSLVETAAAADPSRAVTLFGAWKADPRHAWIDPEPQLNLAGYRLLAEKRIPEAIQIFRLAAEASPQSANAFDSLGEAQTAAGDKEAAIRSYEKALSLDPKRDSARDALAKLRAPGPS